VIEMVYCIHDIDGICKKTNGKCILDDPKTIEDYKKCPKRKLNKHFSEMTREEKNIVIGIQNKRDITEIKNQLGVLFNIINTLSRENKNHDRRTLALAAGHSALTSRLYLLENGKKESIFERMKKWLGWKK